MMVSLPWNYNARAIVFSLDADVEMKGGSQHFANCLVPMSLL